MTANQERRRRRSWLNAPINGEFEGKYSNPNDWYSTRNWLDDYAELELTISLRFSQERCSRGD